MRKSLLSKLKDSLVTCFLLFRGVARNLTMGGKILDRKPHPLINAEKEVIIIACAFQQIIHTLSNNNEQINVDELGVTVKSLEPATLLAGASQPSRTILPDAECVHRL